MNLEQNIKLAVDAVVFGYHARTLQLALVRRKIPPFKGSWALPGGFVHNDESLEVAVQRELREETNIFINYLEQLYTYGAPKRDSRFRVVSVAYYALVRPNQFTLNASSDAEEAQWFSVNNLPSLAFDHENIIKYALQRLRSKVSYEPIGFDLLEKEFLFSQLEDLYATVLNRPLDRRNFRKKILGFGILEELRKKTSKGRGRPASIYKFNKERYFQLVRQGFHFDLK